MDWKVDILSIVTKDLGIVGFILLLLFLLMAIYLKKSDERKVILYVFSFLVVMIVLAGLFYQLNSVSSGGQSISGTKVGLDVIQNSTSNTSIQKVQHSEVNGSIIQNNRE